MASTSFNCSVSQGFNFEPDSQNVVGHLTSLKIGDKEFAQDLEVVSPTAIKSENKEKVVGVISAIFWEGGYADSISVNCQFSMANKKDALVLQRTILSNSCVAFEFIIYDYDPVDKVFYKAFYTKKTPLKGFVAKENGELTFGINMDQSMEVPSPQNFEFYLGIMPKEEQQTLHHGVSSTGKFTKVWGVNVGA